MRFFVVLASLAVGFAGQNISADEISFSFGSTMSAADLAGAPGVRVGNFNSITDGSTHTTVVDSSANTVSGVTAQFVAGGQNFGFSGGSGTNDALMFSGRFDQGPGSSTFTVTNIPYATYDVYMYMHNDTDAGEPGNYRTGEFSIGSNNFFARGALPDPDSAGNGYVISGDATQSGGLANNPLAANTTAGNYVEFVGVTGATLSAIISAGASTEGAPRNKVVGLQIVDTTHVPEPSSVILFGLGAIGLFAVARRRK